MKNILKPIFHLTLFEYMLWLFSALCVTASFLVFGAENYMSLATSLVGVTFLIFIARGAVLGEILTVLFSILYAIVSFKLKYYGEMITYLFMTAPVATFSAISWLRHPYDKEKSEVRVANITKKTVFLLMLITATVTFIFYFILKYMGTSNLAVSTVSVATSFIASSLQFLRSPYYAIGYATNDIVLIVLWTFASFSSTSYIPMVVCFLMFLLNDIHGFVSWLKMRKRQNSTIC